MHGRISQTVETKERSTPAADGPNPHGFGATVASAARVFSAEALLLPTGLVTAIYLTRRLGPADYGLYSLAITLTSWLAWIVGALYSRATVKLISESSAPAPETTPAVTTMLRAYTLTGACGGLALVAGATPLARLFAEENLAVYLRLLSVEVLLFALATAHKDVLVGLRRFRERALCAAARWSARMVLVIGLVHAGLSVAGAVVGSVLATATELAIARWFVRPRFLRSGAAAGGVWQTVAPLMGYAICIKLFQRIDLFALKALGGSAAEAGFYGAAHNLSVALSLLTLSIAPLLLANMVRLRVSGDGPAARRLCSNTLRLAIGLVPFGAAAAAAADRLLPLLFGARFGPAAPLFSVLIFAEIAMVVAAVATSLIVAADRPRVVLAVSAAMLTAAVAGHATMIPRFGPLGAAAVTTTIAVAGAAAYASLATSFWATRLPAGTIVRSASLALPAAAAASVDLGHTVLVIPQLAAIALAICAAFVLTGELTRREKETVLSALRRREGGRKAL